MIRSTLTALAIAASPVALAPAFAQDTAVASVSATVEAPAPSGMLERRAKRLSGGWDVVTREGQTFIRFDDSFRAARGPDLKIFLSPQAYDEVTGQTATNGAINIGELQKTRGAQEYALPEGVPLDDFQSVLVHCEAYSVLWGGSDL